MSKTSTLVLGFDNKLNVT